MSAEDLDRIIDAPPGELFYYNHPPTPLDRITALAEKCEQTSCTHPTPDNPYWTLRCLLACGGLVEVSHPDLARASNMLHKLLEEL